MTKAAPHFISDDDLLKRVSSGDKEAYGMLYERYLVPVYRYCYFRIGSQLDAEDLTEMIFLKAWENLPKKQVQSFRAWLYRIAHNQVVDYLRTRKNTVTLEPLEIPADGQGNPEQVLLNREDGRVLARAIARLDEQDQEVLVCRFVSQLSHAETAAVLGVSESHVRVLQFRALKKLQALLDRGGKQDG
ncbi:RNA polymerase sigma factor, sigma-70 family [Bellilinea caldifistulae]|nr:sigma-70 family RNA polymerase sigma factor [Bellilinea caldifistulae]GAP11964.1 RNA polymerase sigma factor, sigma-70 family [Bellilinea caldifistulae]